MAISSETRRAGPYLGTGSVTVFPFSFKLLDTEHVKVVVSTDGGLTDSTLSSTAYTVALNADQDNYPGGSVTLVEPLADGHTLSILSNAPYAQNMTLTRLGGFYPSILNDNADSLVIQIQQINEKVERAVKVPASSGKTAEEMAADLLSAQQDAREFADRAEQSASEAAAVEDRLTSQESSLAAQLENVGRQQIHDINEAGQGAIDAVSQEGNLQVDRVTAAADSTLWQAGIACQECTWTVNEAVDADTEITIPNGLQYMVGRKHLRVSWNGLMLYPGENFDEVGATDSMSSVIKIHFALSAGDVIDTWVASLGAGGVTEAIDAANTATEAVAELSRKVVYKDAESAS